MCPRIVTINHNQVGTCEMTTTDPIPYICPTWNLEPGTAQHFIITAFKFPSLSLMFKGNGCCVS